MTPTAQMSVRSFVGRDRELETLLDLFAAVEEGRGQTVGIVGEPGVGKSRLPLEFRQRLAEEIGDGTAHYGAETLARGVESLIEINDRD